MLLVIEGIDAAGKATQTRRLIERLEQTGRSVTTLSFPRYNEGLFADAIADYLNGRYGPLESVDPHLAAMLFAGDRYEHIQTLRDAIAQHDAVVLDRYVDSNLAYQGARANAADRPALLDWIERLEYDVYRLPAPDHALLLDIPPTIAADLLHRKTRRTYTDNAADLHERDRAFINSVHRVYHELVSRHPQRWSVISCVDDAGELVGETTIADRIWRAVDAAGLPAHP